MKRIAGFVFAALIAGNAMAFDLTSPDPDVKTGKPMTKQVNEAVREYVAKFELNKDSEERQH